MSSHQSGRNWLNHGPRVVSRLKSAVVPSGERPRSILLGPARGVRMHLDLRHDTQMWLGLYERELQGWLSALARPARTAIDVGASRGRYTLYLLARTGATVRSFEPSREARGALLANLALGDMDGTDRLVLSEGRVGRGDDGSVALDSLLPEVATPCLVKVDVDGGELAVLDGAERLLAAPGVSWIVEVHSREMAMACTARMEHAGLTVRTITNAWWRAVLPEMRPVAVNHWLVALR